MHELEHSAKGSTWKNHKYSVIRMVNGKKRYIYGSPSSGYRVGPSKRSNPNAAIYQRTGQGGPSFGSGSNTVKNAKKMTKTLGNESILTSVRNKIVADYAANKYITKKKVQTATKNAVNKVKNLNLDLAFKGMGNATKLNFTDNIYKQFRNEGTSLDYKSKKKTSSYKDGNKKGLIIRW